MPPQGFGPEAKTLQGQKNSCLDHFRVVWDNLMTANFEPCSDNPKLTNLFIYMQAIYKSNSVLSIYDNIMHLPVTKPGLKVNNQLVAYTTRFLPERLKNHVWSHHRALKVKVQCVFSCADHTNVLQVININLN